MDVAVGTPGRVMDLMNRGALDLGMVKFVILDEADMMLSFGFEEDVETILQVCAVRSIVVLGVCFMRVWLYTAICGVQPLVSAWLSAIFGCVSSQYTDARV